MNKSTFISIISKYISYKKEITNISRILGINLVRTMPVELTDRIFNELIHSYFNPDDAATIIKWCVDKQTYSDSSYIAGGKVIPISTIEDLWNIVNHNKDVVVKVMGTTIGYISNDKLKDLSEEQMEDLKFCLNKKAMANYISECIENTKNIINIDLKGKDINIHVYSNNDLVKKLLVSIHINPNDTTVYDSLNKRCDIMDLSNNAIDKICDVLKSNHRDLWTFVQGVKSLLPVKSLKEVDNLLAESYPYRTSSCLGGINFYTCENREYICTIKKNSDDIYYNDHIIGKIKDLNLYSIECINDSFTMSCFPDALARYTNCNYLIIGSVEQNRVRYLKYINNALLKAKKIKVINYKNDIRLLDCFDNTYICSIDIDSNDIYYRAHKIGKLNDFLNTCISKALSGNNLSTEVVDSLIKTLTEYQK
nr:MAG TPA: hypothetical protein [Bacteriophage sp.]